MNFNKELILDIVRDKIGYEADGIYVSEDFLELNEEDYIYSDKELIFAIESSAQCEVKCGCTKIILIPEDLDYVIKLPITGVYEGNRIVAVLNENEDIFAEENSIYNSGSFLFQKLILPNIYVGEVNGIPIYIQKKVQFIQENLKNQDLMDINSKKSIDAIRTKTDAWIFSNAFIESMIQCYGEVAAADLLYEVKAADIYDLHQGNYGYSKEGIPYVFDIGGYYDERWVNTLEGEV